MRLELKNILNVTEELRQEVRNWRNQDNVKKYMYTDHNITYDEHKNWINSLEDSDNTIVFVVFINDNPEGIVSINKINKRHKNAEWAFYLRDENKKGNGTGILIEYHILNYVFEKLDIYKLNCEVLEINPTVIQLHKKFGFMEEGIRRGNIIKSDKRLDVHLLGINKEEWQSHKSKFEKIIERLES